METSNQLQLETTMDYQQKILINQLWESNVWKKKYLNQKQKITKKNNPPHFCWKKTNNQNPTNQPTRINVSPSKKTGPKSGERHLTFSF